MLLTFERSLHAAKASTIQGQSLGPLSANREAVELFCKGTIDGHIIEADHTEVCCTQPMKSLVKPEQHRSNYTTRKRRPQLDNLH